MLWINVSSRSSIKVFWASLPLDAFAIEYEGCRRGIKGLGGAGARGYLVMEREAAGEVGDFKVAGEMSMEGIASEPLL
jgi:hypothetical protein